MFTSVWYVQLIYVSDLIFWFEQDVIEQMQLFLLVLWIELKGNSNFRIIIFLFWLPAFPKLPLNMSGS